MREQLLLLLLFLLLLSWLSLRASSLSSSASSSFFLRLFFYPFECERVKTEKESREMGEVGRSLSEEEEIIKCFHHHSLQREELNACAL